MEIICCGSNELFAYSRNGPDKGKVVPWGIRKVLNWIKAHYDATVAVTIYSRLDSSDTNDQNRVEYIKTHANEILKGKVMDELIVPVFNLNIWINSS